MKFNGCSKFWVFFVCFMICYLKYEWQLFLKIININSEKYFLKRKSQFVQICILLNIF